MIQENRCKDQLNASTIAIVFEGLGMHPNWSAHLDWLNERNPIQVRTTDLVSSWIGGLL